MKALILDAIFWILGTTRDDIFDLIFAGIVM